ncbi:hypothetical protein LPTSP3_g25810 [Leptospira kobayashii]|uniref:WD40-like protein n=1 Tax=Leptospira kobayashii TaxID=1917830 RepID=A0ABN6KHW3_9LEPT|nr:hypothetical protein [Leptospira kobayashii]BDA79651.1 hypothetical protein LPTSP3_g25810 [Leptospira kobayashii]
MIWKETNLQPEISPSESNDIALLLEVHYEEKDPWNPLNGTTDKKNYFTKADLVEVRSGASKILKTWKIPSWALAESAFYHKGENTAFILHGKDDEYGTLKQRLTVYPGNKPAFSYPATPENLVIFQASPSPNGKLVALITAESNTNWEFTEFQLRILEPSSGKVSSLPLSFWTALPVYGVRWATDSGSLYVRTPDRVYQWKDGKLTDAKSFPNCFTRATNFGKLAYSDSFVEGTNPYQIKLGKKLSDPKFISKLEDIETCR